MKLFLQAPYISFVGGYISWSSIAPSSAVEHGQYCTEPSRTKPPDWRVYCLLPFFLPRVDFLRTERCGCTALVARGVVQVEIKSSLPNVFLGVVRLACAAGVRRRLPPRAWLRADFSVSVRIAGSIAYVVKFDHSCWYLFDDVLIL